MVERRRRRSQPAVAPVSDAVSGVLRARAQAPDGDAAAIGGHAAGGVPHDAVLALVGGLVQVQRQAWGGGGGGGQGALGWQVLESGGAAGLATSRPRRRCRPLPACAAPVTSWCTEVLNWWPWAEKWHSTAPPGFRRRPYTLSAAIAAALPHGAPDADTLLGL